MPKLKGRQYEWLETLGVSPTTAANYMRLAETARANPGIIQHWKELGVSKLYHRSRSAGLMFVAGFDGVDG